MKVFRGALCAVSLVAMAAASGGAAAQEARGDARLEGRVSDSTGTAYFESARVEIVELDRVAVTGDDGGYDFTGLPPGDYTLRVVYIGAEPVETRIVVAPGANREDVRIGEDVAAYDNIIVVGQRSNYARALNAQRTADGVSSVVSSDYIRQFPDQNVTEAAQRVPGVSISRDQGEGRFITIRGADANLNGISVNGVRIPSAESDQRSVALDVIPSELVDTLTISKSLTPDKDGDAIGGAVEIDTSGAFKRDGFSGTLSAEGQYNDLREKVSPRLKASAQDLITFDNGNKLGIAGAISYFDRKLGSDNVENGDGLDEAGGVAFPVVIEPRDYVLTRTRMGAAFNIDYQAGEGNEYYIRSLYSRFADDEIQGGAVFEADPDDGANLVSASGTQTLFANQEVESYVSDRKETQEIISVTAGGKNMRGPWTVEYAAAFALANEDNPDYMETLFVADFSDVANIGTSLADPRIPTITTDNMSAFNDASLYELDEVILEDSFTEDREWSGRLDLQYDTGFGGLVDQGYVKVGGKARLRDKTSDLDVLVYGGADQGLTVADFLNDDIDYPLGLMPPQAIPTRVVDAVRADQAAFDEDFDEEGAFIDSNAEDYDIKEDIFAGYAMASGDFGPLRLVGGARVEHTEYSAAGNELTLDADAETLTLAPIEVERSYTDILPSALARYEFAENVVLRAGYFRALMRPVFEFARPASLVEDGEIVVEAGNTGLDPYYANNFDLSLEFYPGGVGLISAGVFYKDIKNPVFAVDLAGSPGFEGFDEYATYVNGEDARILGFEAAFQKDFSFLPAPFDGLLLSTNYTYVDADAELPLPNGGVRETGLPLQSKHAANVSVGYDKGPFSGRVSMSYRDKYLDEVTDPEDADGDVYNENHVQLDVTASYQATRNIQIFAQGINLNDRPLYTYRGRPGVVNQYEEYGFSASLGVRASF